MSTRRTARTDAIRGKWERLSASHAFYPTIILAAAVFLRFYHLDATSLWSDEGNTWALIQRSFARIATDAAADIHPPGYYWMLKLWTAVVGSSAAGMRSFSAVTGMALVYIIYRIGRELWTPRRMALLAAAIAAVNPFQVYYSQEARMYMLLAVEAAGFFWALLVYMAREKQRRPPTIAACWLLICGAAGLWTHYSFPIVLASGGTAYLFHLWALSRNSSNNLASNDSTQALRSLPHRPIPVLLLRYIAANLFILLLFAPWLPTAINRVLNWPQGGVTLPIADALRLVVHTLAYGPLHAPGIMPELWLWIAGLAPIFGLLALGNIRARAILACWLLGPVLLMFALGLFSDAFLKFLLVASPAWSLAAAALLRLRNLGAGIPSNTSSTVVATVVATAVGLLLVMPAWFLLPGYYTDSTARDNYAGIARYIETVADPDIGLIVLDAPGQQDVWSYYDPGLPVLPLPAQRPPDATATTAMLAQATADRSQVFALFWAEDEADPEHIVEQWLDQHAFKGVDAWQGNVRLVVYTLANNLACHQVEPVATFGAHLRLEALCTGPQQATVTAGEVALVGLRWRILKPIDTRYKISVQLLDQRNQVIAQHDAEPAGGSRPTPTWKRGEQIIDNHGLTIPFGTPPGSYKMIVVVYAADSGARLTSTNGDFHDLGPLTIARPSSPLPLDILPIDHRLNVRLGPVQLAGYNAYRQGFSHARETRLAPGDLAHFTLFWVAPDPLPGAWADDIQFMLQLGDTSLIAALAGPSYPTGNWQPGEVVRGEFDIVVPEQAARPWLQVGDDSIRLHRLPMAP